MKSQRVRSVVLAAAVAFFATITPSADAAATRPAPSFTASSAPLPAPLMTGSWKESDPGRRARLSFAGTNAAGLTTTTYSALWQSKPFTIPENLTQVLSAVPSGYLARVTDGKDTYQLAVRIRMGKQAWTRWYEINGTIVKAPAAGFVLGYAAAFVARPTSLPRGTTMLVELRLRGSIPGDVSIIDSALDVRAGLDAGAPV
jgi:hypothetical protein